MLTAETAASEGVCHRLGPQTASVKGWGLKSSSACGSLQSDWPADMFSPCMTFIAGCVCGCSSACSHRHGCTRVHHEKAPDYPFTLLRNYLCLVDSKRTCLPVSVLCRSVVPNSLRLARLLCPWDSPGKKTGVGYHFLLQGIFPTRNWIWVSCPGRRILNHWATREALVCLPTGLPVFTFIN